LPRIFLVYSDFPLDRKCGSMLCCLFVVISLTFPSPKYFWGLRNACPPFVSFLLFIPYFFFVVRYFFPFYEGFSKSFITFLFPPKILHLRKGAHFFFSDGTTPLFPLSFCGVLQGSIFPFDTVGRLFPLREGTRLRVTSLFVTSTCYLSFGARFFSFPRRYLSLFLFGICGDIYFLPGPAEFPPFFPPLPAWSADSFFLLNDGSFGRTSASLSLVHTTPWDLAPLFFGKRGLPPRTFCGFVLFLFFFFFV